MNVEQVERIFRTVNQDNRIHHLAERYATRKLQLASRAFESPTGWRNLYSPKAGNKCTKTLPASRVQRSDG